MMARNKIAVLVLAAILTMALGITATQVQTVDKTITISLPSEPITVGEGDGTVTVPVTFTLTGNQSTAAGAYVTYSSQGHGDSPATKNQDWQDDPDLIPADNEVGLRSLTTANPVVDVSINISITGDSDNESGEETFTVRIYEPRVNNPAVDADAVLELGVSEVVITIVDDDADVIPPVITLLGANPQTMERGDDYAELGAGATDDVDGDISSDIIIDSSSVDTTTVGNYAVTYAVTDSAGNAAVQATRTVNVVDTTPPTIIAPPDITVEATGPLTTINLGDATVSGSQDEEALRVAANYISLPPVTTTITWTATDSAGNTATANQAVTVQDTTPPTFVSTPQNITEDFQPNHAITYDIPAATDLVDSNVAVTCTPESGSVFQVGTTTVT